MSADSSDDDQPTVHGLPLDVWLAALDGICAVFPNAHPSVAVAALSNAVSVLQPFYEGRLRGYPVQR